MSVPARARVLIVDDDPSLRATVASLLESRRYQVLEAPGVASALRLIARAEIDVVLLDLSLPGPSGADLLRHLRRQARPPQVIILSGDVSVESRVRSLYGGAADYVSKPFEPDELLARLAAAMRQRLDLADARAASITDPMTGLGNRAFFDEALARETKRALRQGRALALVYLDADGLKAVNDHYGHAAGDQYLRLVARTLRRGCRAIDSVARIGGDEFAAILPDIRRADARDFIRRLKEALSLERFAAAPGKHLQVSASMGLAVLGEDAFDAAGLSLAADRALYDDKAGRRPRSRA